MLHHFVTKKDAKQWLEGFRILSATHQMGESDRGLQGRLFSNHLQTRGRERRKNTKGRESRGI